MSPKRRQRANVSLARGQLNLLINNPRVATALAELDEPFRRADVDECVADNLTRLVNKGIVTVAKRYDQGGKGRPGVYAVPDSTRTWIDEHIDWSPPPGPCNHRGVRNVADEPGRYSCLDEDCGARFERDVAEARVGREDK